MQENGKYVCAPVVEKALLESGYIFQGTYTAIHTLTCPSSMACIAHSSLLSPPNPTTLAVVLHGANQPFNTALIVPNWEKLGAWALASSLRGLSLSPSKEELRDHPEVQAFLKQEIVLSLKDRVKKYEMPQAWLLLTEPFTVENELLTPKMSIKRHAVVAKYHAEIEAIYAEAVKGKAGAKVGVAEPAGRPQVAPA